MARISRVTQAIFGITGNVGTAGFGGAAAGTTTTALASSTALSAIMGAAAWASGWLTATLGASKFPALEDMNALNYAVTTQLAYLFQSGVPEYDSGTTYYTNNICIKAATYQLYGSKINANIGNALPSGVSDANWQYLGDLSTLSNTAVFFTGGVSTGSANAQVLASPTPTGFALTLDGATVALTAGFTNTTTTPTFAINGTTATVVKKNGVSGLVALAAGDITVGESIFLTRNVTGSCYVLTDTPPLGQLATLNLDSTNFTSSGGNLAFGSAPALPTNSTATTQAAGNNSTKLATTAYVDARIKLGTSAIMNPVTTASITTQAHGLGATPNSLIAYFECITTDANYAVGDRLVFGGTGARPQTDGIYVEYDATNIRIIPYSAAIIDIVDKSTRAATTMTLANWKLVATPTIIT